MIQNVIILLKIFYVITILDLKYKYKKEYISKIKYYKLKIFNKKYNQIIIVNFGVIIFIEKFQK